VCLEALKISLDCLLDVRQDLRSRLPLGDTTGQRGDFGHKDAILILLNENTKFHLHTPLRESRPQPQGLTHHSEATSPVDRRATAGARPRVHLGRPPMAPSPDRRFSNLCGRRLRCDLKRLDIARGDAAIHPWGDAAPTDVTGKRTRLVRRPWRGGARAETQRRRGGRVPQAGASLAVLEENGWSPEGDGAREATKGCLGLDGARSGRRRIAGGRSRCGEPHLLPASRAATAGAASPPLRLCARPLRHRPEADLADRRRRGDPWRQADGAGLAIVVAGEVTHPPEEGGDGAHRLPPLPRRPRLEVAPRL